MMKKTYRIIEYCLIAAFSFIALVACGGDDPLINPNHQYPERLKLTIMAREFQNDNGELSAASDSVMRHFEEKFNVKFEVINIVSPRQEDIFERQNTLISTGSLPDIMPGRTDFRVANDIYNNLVERSLVVNFSDYVAKHQDRYPVLYSLSQEDICVNNESFKTQSGQNAMIPRYFGPIDHAFIIRKDWLDRLKLPIPKDYNALKNVLIAFNQNDLGGVPHIGLTLPNAWWFDHIIAGFTGAGTFMKVDDGAGGSKYQHTLGSQGQVTGYNYLKELYNWRDRSSDPDMKGLLDSDVFTSQHERDIIAKFNAQQTGVALMGVSYAVPFILPQLQKTVSGVELCYANISGPTAPMRLRMEEYFEGVLVSKRFKDTPRLFDMIEYILSEEGQTMLRYGIENLHYTIDTGTGEIVVNDAKREEEGWLGQLHKLSSLFDCSVTIDEAFSSDYQKINDYIELIRRPESTVKQELQGVVLDSEKDNSKHWDLIATKSANYIKGTESVDWAATYQEFLRLGGQTAIDEVNRRFQPA